jgi:hypothetical protein
MDNTYVIAAGPSNESHMPVVDEISEEYDNMVAYDDGDLFYHASTEKTFVHHVYHPRFTQENC